LRRPPEELTALYTIIGDTIGRIIEAGYCVRLTGNAEALPESMRDGIAREQVEVSPESRLTVNVAIGYGGREEIVDAVQELVRDLAAQGLDGEGIAAGISVESVAGHPYPRGPPAPAPINRP